MSDSKKTNYVVVSQDEITPLYTSDNEKDCKNFLEFIINLYTNDFKIMKEDDYYKSIAKEIQDCKEEIEYITKQQNQQSKKIKILH